MDSSDQPAASTGGAYFRRRPLVVRLLAAAVLAVVVIAWFAPTLVAVSPLRNSVLQSALPDGSGTLTAESASLGWFSPVRLYDVQLTGPSGEPLLTVPQLETSQSLLALLVDPTEVGEVHVDEPQATIHVTKTSSNLEEFLAAYLRDEEPSPARNLQLHVTGGTVVLHEPAGGQPWRIEQLATQLTIAKTEPVVRQFELSAIVPNGSSTGQLEAHLKTGLANTFELTSEAIPLSVSESLLARFVPEAELAGSLSVRLSATWSGPAAEAAWLIDGNIDVAQLDFTAAALSGDHIQLAELHVPWQVTREGNRVEVSQLALESDVASARINGAFPAEVLSSPWDAEALAESNFDIIAHVDLARLGNMMPRLLHVREGTELTSGQVEVRAASNAAAPGSKWTASIRTSELAAVHQGQPLRWDRPFQADFTAKRSGDDFVLERLAADAGFAQVVAAGSRQYLQGTASADLAELHAQLSQFFDLGGWQVKGQGRGDFVWRETPEGAFDGRASVEVVNWQLSNPSGRSWAEPRLSAQASAVGELQGTSLTRLETAWLQFTGQGDQLSLRLAKPVDRPGPQQPLSVDLDVNTNLAHWATTLNRNFDGVGRATGRLHYSPEKVQLNDLMLTVDRLRVSTEQLHIDEPQVKLVATAAAWDRAAQQLGADRVQLTSPTITVDARKTKVNWAESELPRIQSQVDFRADLARLSGWRAAASPDAVRLVGSLAGQASVQRNDQTTTATLTARASELVIWRPADQAGVAPQAAAGRWQQPLVTLAAEVSHDARSGSLRVAQSEIVSDDITVAISGSVDTAGDQRQVDLTGTFDYDLAKLTPLVQQYAGPTVQLDGRRQGSFALSGPWGAVAAEAGQGEQQFAWLRPLSGNARAGWQSIRAFGLTAGQGELSANLRGGIVQVDPFEIAVSEGRILGAPQVHLAVERPAVVLPRGQLIDQVHISPEVIDAGLKYVSPLLSQATRSQGRFSLAIDGAQIPLDQPIDAGSRGELTIHEARVTPGPLAMEILAIARQIRSLRQGDRLLPQLATAEARDRTLLEMSQEQIAFEVSGRRVHHRGVTANVGDVEIRTHGSVGFDQTLAIVAEVPIRDDWVGQRPWLAGLRGQTMQFPVRGTLSRPELDPQTLRNLNAQLIGNAVEGAVLEGLQRLLERRRE
ncbi:MAG: hypothetical protein WDZ59_12730 [Pirellulales bacterium]